MQNSQSQRLKTYGNAIAFARPLWQNVAPASWRGILSCVLGGMMSDEAIQKFWNIDFKALIPVILFLVTQMVAGGLWISRIDGRLTMREAMVEPTMKRIDRLELDRDAIIRVQEQLKNLALSIDKIDRKLDSQK